MRKTVYSFVLPLCIAAIIFLPQLTAAQDSRARVEEVLSYFPAGLYSYLDYYDFEAIRAAPSFDLYDENFGWTEWEQKELSPLAKELSADVSSLAKAVRVRFRISGLKEDAGGKQRPEILLDEDGIYQRNLDVTDQTFTMFGDKQVVILNYGRVFRVYRIVALDDLLKRAVKNGSMAMEDGSILGVPYYRIESNPAEVPYLCCTVEPDMLLMAEDKSMLEDLVAVSTGGEASLTTEEHYDEVILLGAELGQRWSIVNWLKESHSSIVRKLIDFGISEEVLQDRIEKSLEGTHFSVSTYILGSEIVEREMEICGSEEGAAESMEYRKSNPRYSIDDSALEAAKRFNRAYNAAWKISRDGTAVTSDVNYDKELLALKVESDQAWREMREAYKKEKEAEAARKKENAEKK